MYNIFVLVGEGHFGPPDFFKTQSDFPGILVYYIYLILLTSF